MRYLSTQAYWPDIKPYLQISQIVQTWINDLMSRLKLNPDMSLNIGQLFPNATLLREYMQAALSLDEQTAIKLMTGVTLKPGKVCCTIWSCLFNVNTTSYMSYVVLI